MTQKNKLRSSDWFGKDDKMGFVHRSWFRTQGYPNDYFQNKPVIGICNTWSELTPCNGHLRDLAEVVKRGVIEAGGFPLEFPVTSLGETVMRPTTMLFRNLASMDVEETIRANPIDGVCCSPVAIKPPLLPSWAPVVLTCPPLLFPADPC